MSQNEEIYEYMKTHGHISPQEAVALGCYRLSARIHDLRRMGLIIVSERKPFIAKSGRSGYYSEYRVVENGERKVD